MYFRYERALVTRFFGIFGVGILCRSSCISPSGQRYPQIVQEYTNRLHEKVKELLGDTQIDESRIATELVLFSDKICTDEETVRLRSHISSMKDTLCAGGSILLGALLFFLNCAGKDASAFASLLFVSFLPCFLLTAVSLPVFYYAVRAIDRKWLPAPGNRQ